MSNPSDQATRTFTVREANAALPLVRAITRDLVALSQSVSERHARLAELVRGRTLRPDDPYADELRESAKGLEKERDRLAGFIAELHALGVEPKSALEGLIDFPAWMDGRRVYLCWKLGEPEVLYYHELDGGFAGRKRLPESTQGQTEHGELEHSCT